MTLADGTSVDLTADAGDLDGDPIFITWSSDGGATLTTDGGEQRGLHLAVPSGTALCSNTTFSLVATVSDGYAPHTNTVAIPVTVTRSGVVTAPIITPSLPTVTPGSAPLAFSGSTSGGCPPSTWAWTSSTGQVGAAQNFNWTVPALSCTPDGGTEWVDLSVSDSFSSAGPTRMNIRVLPTASLVSPTVTPSPIVVDAGAGPVTFTATPGAGCPPTTYSWNASDSTSNSGPGTTFSFTPPALLCTTGTASAWVDVVASDGTRTSSTLRTNITIRPTTALEAPNISPPSASTTPGASSITFHASSDAGCPPSTWSWKTSENGTGSGVDFAYTPPALSCTPDGGTSWVELVASDATRLSPAVRANVTYPRTATMGPPTVTPSSPAVLPGSSTTFTAAPAGGCAPTTYSWTSSTNVTGSGTTFAFVAPAVVCDADAGAAWVDVFDSDGIRTSSTVRTAITIVPNPTLATPGISPSALTVVAGSAPLTFTANNSGVCAPTSWTWTASDGTGDAGQVFVWTPPAGNCDPDGGTVLIQVVASNGLVWSDAGITAVRVLPNGKLPLPDVTTSLLPNDAGYHFVAGMVGSCIASQYAWTTTDGKSGAGNAFDWAPAEHACDVDAGTVVITATGTRSGSAPVSRDVSLTVDPWGVPEAPVFDGGTQVAGSSQVWTPEGTAHVCASAPGFPGTELVWLSLDAGIDSGIELTPVAGGLLVSSLDACRSGTVTGTAVRAVSVAGSPRSAPGQLAVQVVSLTNVSIDSPDQLDFTYSLDGGLHGTFAVDAGCLAGRGLFATISLDGGGAGCETAAPLGAWDLTSCQFACDTRTYDLVAELWGPDGGMGLTKSRSLTLTGGTTSVAGVSATELHVACGAASPVELNATLSSQCGTVPTLSFQIGAPGSMTLTGKTTAHFEPATTGFELLGQPVLATAVPDNNTGAKSTSVLVTADPFLALTVHAAQLPAHEEEAAVISVDVTNTTTCDVHGVDVKLDHPGLVPIDGSLTVDGAPRGFDLQGGQIVVSGLDVAGLATHQVRFKAHVVMLGRTGVAPWAYVGPVPVGPVAAKTLEPTGCGCSASLPGPEWLSALALIAWVRRRRRAC